MREEPAQGCTGGGGERSPGAQGVPRLPRGTTGDEERIREGGTGDSGSAPRARPHRRPRRPSAARRRLPPERPVRAGAARADRAQRRPLPAGPAGRTRRGSRGSRAGTGGRRRLTSRPARPPPPPVGRRSPWCRCKKAAPPGSAPSRRGPLTSPS